MRHQHSWVEVGRTFIPPCPVTSYKGGTSEELFRLLNGYTTVELRCKDCGDVTSRTLTGDRSVDAHKPKVARP
jgi:uncharacterized Zn finger protein